MARNSEAIKRAKKKYYDKNRDRLLAVGKDWRDRNPDYNKNWAKTNPERKREINRRSQFKQRYGISEEERDEMVKAQENKCCICAVEFDWSKKNSKPHVDHCHVTGKIRGILCGRCNLGLGQLNDDPDLLRKAISYLESK